MKASAKIVDAGILLSSKSEKKDYLWLKWLTVLVAGLAGAWIGNDQGLTNQASIFFGIFLFTVAGLILNPVPGQQIVLTGILLVALTGVLPLEKALSGYGDPIVWLVLSACLMSRGMIKTGLGKRISLHLIQRLGKSTLGLGYSLVFTDLILGSIIPSNGARSGGIIYPIAKGLCDAYDSHPKISPRRLGAFLFTLLYQADVLVCALFLTGQASNVLIAKFAKQATGVEITYGSWLWATLVPGALSFIALPLLFYKFYPPEVKHTPSAPANAKKELESIGPMTQPEKIMMGVFALVISLWVTVSLHQLNYTVIALLGVCVLLMSRVLKWDDITSEKPAWDIYIWYGGLVMLASGLQSLGISQHFAGKAAGALTGQPWHLALVVLVGVYFFAHYAFASVTAHVTAMFVPFLTVILAGGAPPWLAVLLLAVFSNLCACLTHFGTTPGPIYFGTGYVSQQTWWKIGFFMAIFHIVVWSTVGVAWWHFIGKV